jgi:hypothetical protein
MEFIVRGNQRTRRRTCPIATLSTTVPKWTEQGANPGLRGQEPAINCLSAGSDADKLLPPLSDET